MKRILRNFRSDDSGAITVDWVILTAVIMAAVFLLTTPLREGLDSVLLAVTQYLNATGDDLAAVGSGLD